MVSEYWMLPSLIAGLLSIGLGSYIFKHKSMELHTLLFVFLMFCCAIWAFGEVFMQLAGNLQLASFWGRFSTTGVVFIPTILLHFAMIYPRCSRIVYSHINYLWLLWLPSFGFLLLTWFTNAFFRIVEAVPSNNQEVVFTYAPSHFYPLFLLLFFFYMLGAVIKLFVSYLRLETTTDKLHTKYLGCGIMVIIFVLLLDIVLAVTYPALPIAIFDSCVILLIVCFFTAAVTRYDILELHTIIEKSVAYFGISVVVIAMFVVVGECLEYTIQNFIAPDSPSILPNIVAALMVAFSFRSIEEKIKLLADKIFPQLKSFE